MENIERIIGLDPGSSESGMCVLDNGQIVAAFNLNYEQFWIKVTNYLLNRNCTVVIEDIRPYSLKLTPQVIDTCKLIGEAVYRLRNDCGVNVQLVTRFEVKKWVFDTFPVIATEFATKKIEKKLFDACELLTRCEIRVDTNGKPPRKPSFIHVDDKIVTEAMKYFYRIPKPDPGDGYRYGLKDHSWQALGAATYFTEKKSRLTYGSH